MIGNNLFLFCKNVWYFFYSIDLKYFLQLILFICILCSLYTFYNRFNWKNSVCLWKGTLHWTNISIVIWYKCFHSGNPKININIQMPSSFVGNFVNKSLYEIIADLNEDWIKHAVGKIGRRKENNKWRKSIFLRHCGYLLLL